ncbi:LysR family transcriptional regulator [Actinomadura xylanilytica]|uniref:LysR family transcriptional regulator n=1 Tax=Actinomadura xylanilytica TaxID=887459 RepID=UPI00255B29A1|nr:LysR family transcriptional regulator [Actinomadura xylanilytica]MDL4775937.1 LysR family transcriptional regulator [Actinomadura xylanilytica]
MDLTTVRWFLAVADLGHVTNAAAELRISQPGLSRAIARLERELDAPLFDRAGRGVVLSRYGEVFAEHARRLVAEEEAARRALVQAADPERGEVSLAFLHTQGPLFVPDLIRRFRGEHPGVTFRLIQDRAERLAAAVREGRADLAVTSPDPDDPALVWRPLVTERLQLAVPAGHRLAGRRRARLADVADEPFVAFRRGAGLRTIFEELSERVGVRPRIAFEGEESWTVRGLVGAGLGVAIVAPRPDAAGLGAPEGGPESPHGVRHLALADPGAVRTIGLVWAAERTRPPAAEGFRRFVLAPGAS